MRTLLATVAIVVATLGGTLPSGSPLGEAPKDPGQAIYKKKCSLCHGVSGKGDGPAGAALDPPPSDFTDPKFWQGDVEKKITDSATNGKGQMPPSGLSPEQIKSVIGYMTAAFKKAKDGK